MPDVLISAPILEGPETERLVNAVPAPVPTFPFNATVPVLVIVKAWVPLIVPDKVRVPEPEFTIVVAPAQVILPEAVAPNVA